MSKANVLYYYKTKSDIYFAVLEDTLTGWLTPLAELDPNGEPAEEIWAYVVAKLETSQSQPEASKLFANEIMQGAPMIREYLRTDLKQLVDEKCKVIQQWIDDGKLVDISPLHLLFMIWATTQHYADFNVQTNLLTENPGQLFAEAEQTLKAVFLNGLMPRT